MRFLADESCDFAVVRALRTAGHDVESVTETCRGAPDEVVTQLSVQTRCILFTEDKDFGQLVYAGSGLSLGVTLIRFPGNARQGMVKAILELLERVGDELQDRFVVVQPGRVRISRYASGEQ